MIALGCDHGGYALMQSVKKYLEEKGLEYKDFGTYSEESCDYPIYGEAVAKAIVNGECERGIIICGTGIGISIAANKVKGIRAALCHNEFTAQMCREHNNAQILSMGARVLEEDMALRIVETFLNTEFAGGRHETRVNKLMEIENH
ncbi:MAG: ribose 5-phosphate isomerase B [Oscillospiraceae bacterium]|nr:ribose 5-phosphate isomerase B [Oscillospiraceae bacterium]